MNNKEKLIKLFEQSCSDFNIPRSLNERQNDINKEIENKILTELYPNDIYEFRTREANQDSLFYPSFYPEIRNLHGFDFEKIPEIRICKCVGDYFTDSYIKKNWFRNGNLQELINKTKFIFKSFEDRYKIKYSEIFIIYIHKYIIIQGTIYSELTEQEYTDLLNKYKDSVYKYDEYMLNERLK